jgi:hypothetical protein
MASFQSTDDDVRRAGRAGIVLVQRVLWQAALGVLMAAGCSADIPDESKIIVFAQSDRRKPVSAGRFRKWVVEKAFGLSPGRSITGHRRVSDTYARRIAGVLIKVTPALRVKTLNP